MGKKEKTVAEIRQISILQEALQEIDQIVDFICFVNLQPLNAVKVADKIWSTIDRIAIRPFSFRECEEIPTKTKMYRRAVCLSWLIIYKITATEIIILSVVHGARKPSKIRTAKKRK